MANLTESSAWETYVYEIGTTDAVQGGPGGVNNCQPQQLANRTKKIYDTLATRGVFIDLTEEVFVGQPTIMDATFEGTVADGDIVYYNVSNVQFEKAIVDATAAQNVVGFADVTNSKVLSSGLVITTRTDTPGDILYLSAITPGAITLVDTGVSIGRYQYDSIIFLSPAASATAAAATIAPGSIGPDKFTEAYYTETEIDAKCTNWDTAYTEHHQWDGGATNLVAATGRTSLEITGDVTTHCHDAQYYTETEIDAKCTNWDTAYTQTRQWDGGATSLVAATGRTSLEITGDVTTHCHGSYYFTKSEINACCGNWDSAYTERRNWDGGATNLNAATGRTSLGLDGDVTTHCHDAQYYTETEINTKCTNWDSAYTERRNWDGGATNLVAATGRTSLGLTGDVTTHCHDARYYTETEIDTKCTNWDRAYARSSGINYASSDTTDFTVFQSTITWTDINSLSKTGDISVEHSIFDVTSNSTTLRCNVVFSDYLGSDTTYIRTAITPISTAGVHGTPIYSNTLSQGNETPTNGFLDIDCSGIANGIYDISLQLFQADGNDSAIYFYNTYWT